MDGGCFGGFYSLVVWLWGHCYYGGDEIGFRLGYAHLMGLKRGHYPSLQNFNYTHQIGRSIS